jgi:hypothetical protein
MESAVFEVHEMVQKLNVLDDRSMELGKIHGLGYGGN